MASITWPYNMPYDTIEVHDNSIQTETVSRIDFDTIPTDPIAFIPFVSEKGVGEDDKLVYIPSGAISRYGNPNVDKYGLSLYLANQFVAGQGNLLGMRMKADDATHANLGIYAKIKIHETILTKKVTETNEQGDEKVVYYPYYTPETGVQTVQTIKDVTYDPSYVADDESDPVEKVICNNSDYTLDDLTFKLTTTDGTSTVYNIVKRKVLTSTIVTKSFDGSDAYSDKSLKTIFLNGRGIDGDLLPDDITNLTEDKEYKIPLFMIYSKPTGSAANNYRFIITKDSTMEEYAEQYGYPSRFYMIQSYDGNAELESKMSFTFTQDFIYEDQSMYIEDVFSDHSTNLGVIISSDVIDKYRDVIAEYVTNSNDLVYDNFDPEYIDFIFGSDRDDEGFYRFEPSADGINLSSSAGQVLTNGSLGVFANPDKTVRTKAINKKLAEVYSGLVTDLIYDEVRYPYEFIFSNDFTYGIKNADSEIIDDGSADVLNAMSSLIDNRKSSFAFYNVPNITLNDYDLTYSTNRTVAKQFFGTMDTYKSAIYGESAMVRDSYSHKRKRFPATYFLAYAVPYMIKNSVDGRGNPLAGQNFKWSGFITNTMLPSSTSATEYIANHKASINSMVEDGTGKAEAYEQITTYNKLSELAEINNAITLNKMCSIALATAKLCRWVDLSDDEINSYKTKIEDNIKTKLNGTYKSIEITTERETVNGAGRRRIKCKIWVKFSEKLKGVDYEFYVL